MDTPTLIDAPVKERDAGYRPPAWAKRADWSSRNALLAFWSAHPPEMRNDFLKSRAESYVNNFREQLGKNRAEMSRLWKARKELIESEADKIAKLPADNLAANRQREIREEYAAKLLTLRAEMRVARNEVRRSIKYLRAIEPKKVNQIAVLGEMVSAMVGKRVSVIIQKPPQTYTVISLWQPWASMVAWGLKQYETRHWTTQHRGALLIHAAKRWTAEEKAYCLRHPFSTAIRERLGGVVSDFPFGSIIAVAELVSIHPTATLKGLTADERAVGNFAPGRFAWKLANVRELGKPIPVKGGQGLFKWTGVIDV